MELVLTTVIAVCAFFSLLIVSINWMLSSKIDPLEGHIGKLEGCMDKLEGRMNKLEGKLDQLLALSK